MSGLSAAFLVLVSLFASVAFAQSTRAVGVDGPVLTLVPAKSLHDVEQVLLTAHFADGAAPSSATFLLRVVPPALAERQVEVHRRPRTLESYQQELGQLHAERQQCVRELDRLRAEPARLDGISGMMAAGHLNSTGVPVREVGRELIQAPRNPLTAKRAWTYRANNRVAVVVEFLNPKLQSWRVEGAALEDKAGVPLRPECFYDHSTHRKPTRVPELPPPAP